MSDPLPLTKEQRTLIAQALNDGVKLLLAYEARVAQLEVTMQKTHELLTRIKRRPTWMAAQDIDDLVAAEELLEACLPPVEVK